MLPTMDEVGLAPGWRRWIRAALERGCTPAAIARDLICEGVEEALAVREIGIIDDALGELSPRLELLRRMLDTVETGRIERRPLCDADTFFRECFTRYRPVLFARGASGLRAAGWSFTALRDRFGERSLTIGERRMSVAEAVDAFLSDAPPELYITSGDRALHGPLVELRDDLTPLPDFLKADAPTSANLWMGPAGTTSPLHHDTTHVYFCQLVGRKRYRLVAPWKPQVLTAPIERGWDSTFDVERAGAEGVHDLVLEPGDALYIPTGWWHRVDALDPSISVSLRSFRWPAAHAWYAPGTYRRQHGS